jgi:hypothetical protein
MKKYELMATCAAGAKTFTQGYSIADCLNKFYDVYTRKGWQIIVRDLTTCKTVAIIKKTFQ